jgi:hypothetical protein
VQRVLQVLLLVGAVAVAFFPRRKSPLQLAALTAVLLAGFELVLTYWLYTYIPWFYPFAALTLLAPALPLRRLVTQEGASPEVTLVPETYPGPEIAVPGRLLS